MVVIHQTISLVVAGHTILNSASISKMIIPYNTAICAGWFHIVHVNQIKQCSMYMYCIQSQITC